MRSCHPENSFFASLAMTTLSLSRKQLWKSKKLEYSVVG